MFSTLHTRSASQTVSRVIDIFSEGEKEQVRMQLSDALVAVFSQRLLKKIDGTGVHMVKEILLNNNAIHFTNSLEPSCSWFIYEICSK